MALSPLFEPVSFDRLPGWSDDNPTDAFAAFRRSAFHVRAKPYRTGSFGVEAAAFNDARAKADAVSNEEMGKMTSGLPLPPGFKLPF